MTNQVEPFSISRVFDAPQVLVFQAYTDVSHLARWGSPTGFKVIHAELDLRVGGSYHYGLRGADGSEMWGKQVYREIVAPQKLVFVQSFSNPEGGLARHPMAPTWPLEMLATTTFEDIGDGKTKLTINWKPLDTDEAALATFDAARAGMSQGWAGTFANLEAHLTATDAQLFNSRMVDAPRELVWRALTEAQHVNAWWGPNGFHNEVLEQELRVGGHWKFTMVGPDGTKYPNLATFIEITPPERLVYDHGDWEAVQFRAAITLEQVGKKTLVTIALTCPSREWRDARLGYAIVGGQQTLAKLAAHLRTM